ncbi:unnamed protein product, partial [Rotaria sordida]
RTLCIWPFPVTSMIIAQHYNDIIHENEITYDIYVDFIKKNLFQLDAKATLYKYEFNATKHRIETGSDKLTHKIDDFVQKNHQVTAVRLHFEARMELAEYVYLDQVLQFKFFQEKPNEQQIKLAQSICALQLQKEKSEQELILFKFGILYKKLPDSLNALEETPSTLITSITNSQQRERLSNNYMRIIQRAKADLMMVLTQATEIKTQEHQTNFDTFMAQLWNDQRHLPQQERCLNNADVQELWTPYIDRQNEEIPMIHVRPFQHDAPLLDCIKRRHFRKYDRQLHQQNYLIMKSTKNNLRYVCHKNMFDAKTNDYMLRTKAYTEIENLQVSKRQDIIQQLFNTMVNEIETLLTTLYNHELITTLQYHQMNCRPATIHLDYMSFNPTTDEYEEVMFEPSIISTLSPLMPICRYLHRLLAPLYHNQVARLTTVTKGADLIQRLEFYQQQGYLQSSTYFISICIRDPYESISHSELIKNLKHFLVDYIMDDKIQGMNLMAIIKLTEFLLQHQYFLYNNCIYQQVQGGGTGLYFLELLIDIYLFYWQQTILAYQNQNEIFVRCFSNLFLTSNEAKEKLELIFDKIKKKDSYIQYDIQMKTEHIHFLDAQIHHWHKQTLQTEVYHDWKFEPYIMPTMYDASAFSSWNLIQTALIRAVLCCAQSRQFFTHFQVSDFTLYYDQATYDVLRRSVRQYDEENKEKIMKSREETQKQCIWYSYSNLTGSDLYRAKQNPRELLPAYLYDNYDSQGITIEIVHLAKYPSNTN